MRKIIVSEYVSLDGIFENPSWTMPYWNDEIAKFKLGELFNSGALLLGRVTYEGFAAAWPGRTDEQGYADRINSLPKYVVSSRLRAVAWENSHLIRSNIDREIARLKEEPGHDLLVFGSGQLVESLADHGLVDEYIILVYPLVLGNGRRLFQDGSQKKLQLVHSQVFSSGVVALTYRPEGAE